MKIMLKKVLVVLLAVSMLVGNLPPMSVKAEGEKPVLEDVCVSINQGTTGSNNEYTGSPVTPEVIVTYRNTLLEETKDYTVSYENNVNVGNDAVAIITGCGDYEGLKIEKKFPIIKGYIYNEGQSYNWTVEAEDVPDPADVDKDFRVHPTVTDRNGNLMVEGKDYIVKQKPYSGGVGFLEFFVYGIGSWTGVQYGSIEVGNPWGDAEEVPGVGERVPADYTFRVNSAQKTYTIKEGETVDFVAGTSADAVKANFILIKEETDANGNIEYVTLRDVTYGPENTNDAVFNYTFDEGVYAVGCVWQEYKKQYDSSTNTYTVVSTGVSARGTCAIIVEADESEDDGSSDAPVYGLGWIESITEDEPIDESYYQQRLTVTTVPESNLTPIGWESSNSKVAKVTNGYVKWLKPGTVTIKAYIAGKEVSWKLTKEAIDFSLDGEVHYVGQYLNHDYAYATYKGGHMYYAGDYTVAKKTCENLENVSLVTITGLSLFKGSFQSLCYTDTGYPYHCEHIYSNSGDLTCDTCGMERKVVEASILSYPTKKVYQIQEKVDVTGGFLDVTYNDGSKGELPMTSSMIPSFNTSYVGKKAYEVIYNGEVLGSYEITIACPGHNYSKYYPLTCLYCGAERTQEAVVIGFRPFQLEYELGEEFSVYGGEIEIQYSEGDSFRYDMTLDMISGFDSSKPGKQTITVTYEGEVAGTFEVTVLAPEISEIELYYEPDKTDYEIGEDLDVSGGEIRVWYDNDTEETIEITEDMVFGFNNSKSGYQTLEVTYEGEYAGSYEVYVYSYSPFEDVEEHHWFHDYVMYAYNRGLMYGTDDTIFDPNANLTRAQFATILYRINGEVVQYDSKFKDVPAKTWYSEAVTWASDVGVVSGYGNGLFGTNDKITREQMAAMMYRYAKYKGYDVSVSADLGQFADANKVSSYAKESLEWAVGIKLINGKGAGKLDPSGNATRAECATIITKFDQTF